MIRAQQIAWVSSSTATLARLRNIVPLQTRVVDVDNAGRLLEGIARDAFVVTVVEAGGAHQELALSTCRRVFEAFPQHPLIAWCNLRTIHSTELLDIARAGVQEIVRHELDEARQIFARIMSSATQRAVSVSIAQQLDGVIPARLRALLLYALEHADEHMDRAAFAAVFGISRRTLHGRLAEAGLPATREFLTWSRVLIAAALLDQPGHSLESVAGQLNFADGHVLRATLRRYTGVGLQALRGDGVLESVLAAFRLAVRADSAASLPEPSSAD